MDHSTQLRRRVFLGALGAGLSLPLAEQASRLAIAAPGPRPTRLFIYYVPHGVPIEHFDPVDGSGNLALQASGMGMLSPLAPFVSQLTVVRGLHMASGASNHAAIRTVLTGSGDGSSDSIDFVIAQALGTEAHALGVVPYRPTAGYGYDSNLIRHGSWVRPTESPVLAAEQLLGAIGGAPAEGNSEQAFRERAMALTEAQLEQLHGTLGGLTTEQNKLALHLESLRSLKAVSAGAGNLQISCDSVPSLPSVDALGSADPMDPSQVGRVLDGHLEVAAHALTCGSARVISLQNFFANANINMGFEGGPGIDKAHHDPISHSWDSAGRAEFAQVQSWFYQRLVEKLLTPLSMPDPIDPEHTVLDNSIVVVCSEVSDGAQHNSDAGSVWVESAEHANYLPFFLIGGGGGCLSGGRVVHSDASNADLLASVALAMGVSIDTLGGSSVSPIDGVLV